jgi:hypothetical protein
VSRYLIYVAKNLSTGGIRQLSYLVSVLRDRGKEVTLYANKNVLAQIAVDFNSITAKHSWLHNEIEIRRISSSYDELVCFSNLPTLFSLRCNQLVFIQNRYLVEKDIMKGLDTKFLLKTLAQRFFLRWFIRNAGILVQTATMAFHAHKMQVPYDRIYLLHKLHKLVAREYFKDEMVESTFFYPTSLDTHKNIKVLLLAWRLLEYANLPCKLEVTVTKDQIKRVTNLIDNALSSVVFLGHLSEVEVNERINITDYLIYPSHFESLGFSLLDAARLNKPILSTEASYVYDVCSPKMTFDSKCELSVARTIARAMGHESLFLDNLFGQLKTF